jgi:hypothetical protein
MAERIEVVATNTTQDSIANLKQTIIAYEAAYYTFWSKPGVVVKEDTIPTMQTLKYELGKPIHVAIVAHDTRLFYTDALSSAQVQYLIEAFLADRRGTVEKTSKRKAPKPHASGKALHGPREGCCEVDKVSSVCRLPCLTDGAQSKRV